MWKKYMNRFLGLCSYHKKIFCRFLIISKRFFICCLLERVFFFFFDFSLNIWISSRKRFCGVFNFLLKSAKLSFGSSLWYFSISGKNCRSTDPWNLFQHLIVRCLPEHLILYACLRFQRTRAGSSIIKFFVSSFH